MDLAGRRAGVVEWHCGRNYAHVTDIPPVESDGNLRRISFDDVTCPICEADRTGWIPPSHIRLIVWEES